MNVSLELENYRHEAITVVQVMVDITLQGHRQADSES